LWIVAYNSVIFSVSRPSCRKPVGGFVIDPSNVRELAEIASEIRADVLSGDLYFFFETPVGRLAIWLERASRPSW
jgi:hypothetical protein